MRHSPWATPCRVRAVLAPLRGAVAVPDRIHWKLITPFLRTKDQPWMHDAIASPHHDFDIIAATYKHDRSRKNAPAIAVGRACYVAASIGQAAAPPPPNAQATATATLAR